MLHNHVNAEDGCMEVDNTPSEPLLYLTSSSSTWRLATYFRSLHKHPFVHLRG